MNLLTGNHRHAPGLVEEAAGAERLDPAAALRLVLGRKPMAAERTQFAEALAQARAAGATDALIVHCVRETSPGDGAGAGPDAARVEARRLVDSWAKAGLEPRRESVQAIIEDVQHAWGYMRQKGLPTWDMGRARNERVLRWARREASALRAADGRAGP